MSIPIAFIFAIASFNSFRVLIPGCVVRRISSVLPAVIPAYKLYCFNRSLHIFLHILRLMYRHRSSSSGEFICSCCQECTSFAHLILGYLNHVLRHKFVIINSIVPAHPYIDLNLIGDNVAVSFELHIRKMPYTNSTLAGL